MPVSNKAKSVHKEAVRVAGKFKKEMQEALTRMEKAIQYWQQYQEIMASAYQRTAPEAKVQTAPSALPFPGQGGIRIPITASAEAPADIPVVRVTGPDNQSSLKEKIQQFVNRLIEMGMSEDEIRRKYSVLGRSPLEVSGTAEDKDIAEAIYEKMARDIHASAQAEQVLRQSESETADNSTDNASMALAPQPGSGQSKSRDREEKRVIRPLINPDLKPF